MDRGEKPCVKSAYSGPNAAVKKRQIVSAGIELLTMSYQHTIQSGCSKRSSGKTTASEVLRRTLFVRRWTEQGENEAWGEERLGAPGLGG
jgi:hypothetical protein